jgi:Protein of unknown function (DUF2851)
MNEKLLHFIWLHQYYNKLRLKTTDGEPLEIIYNGMPNPNQGPDFLNTRIRVGKTTWAGNIELHVLASDWHKHRHVLDSNYRNVILHVVWRNNISKKEPAGFPVLELQSLVPKVLLARYKRLMEAQTFIPCGNALTGVPELVMASWKEKLLVERLEKKVADVFAGLLETGDHWEEVFWRLLCKNFGVKVNTGAFESIARTVSLSIINRNRHSTVKLEALLMGQADLLNDSFKDDYALLLKKEYGVLKRKYHLKKPVEPILFLRMRPQSFPTVRLSQLAQLMSRHDRLFSKITNVKKTGEIKDLFQLEASEYWNNHYRFDQATSKKAKIMGVDMMNNLLINTIIPIVFSWGIYQSNEKMKQKALNWLMELPAEVNIITKGFTKMGLPIRSAYDSQAFIQLKNNYCREKRCLQCAAGSVIMRKD